MPSLSDFWNLEISRLEGQLNAAKQASLQAGVVQSAASASLAAINRDLAAARAAAASARKALASIPLPADGDAQLLALRSALRQEAGAYAEQSGAEANLQVASANRAAAEEAVSDLNVQLAQAKAQAKAEASASVQRNLWKAAAAVLPPDDPVSRAADALSDFKTAALALISADFPANADPNKDFLTRVRARRALAKRPTADAQLLHQDALALTTSFEESSGRAAAKLPALRRSFEAACANLQEYFQATVAAQSAASQLQAIAERGSSPLSAAARAELFATGNAALQSEREAALAALAARDGAQKLLWDKQLDYQRALLPLQIAHPGSNEAALRALDANLDNLFAEATIAAQDLLDADSVADLASHRQSLQDWYACVPQLLWQQLEQLDASIASLEHIQSLNPGNLLSALTVAETALVNQWQLARDELITQATRSALAAFAQAKLAAAVAMEHSRLPSAAHFVELI